MEQNDEKERNDDKRNDCVVEKTGRDKNISILYMKNILIGVKNGILPGWASSVATTYIIYSLDPEESGMILLPIFASFIGWIPGMIGGAIGGALSAAKSDKTNISRNGAIGGVLLPIIVIPFLLKDVISTSLKKNSEAPSSTSSSS